MAWSRYFIGNRLWPVQTVLSDIKSQATMIRYQEHGVFCSGNSKNDTDQISKFTLHFNLYRINYTV